MKSMIKYKDEKKLHTKRKELNEAIKDFQGKQSAGSKTPKKVRQSIDAHYYLIASILLTLWRPHSSGSSPCAQKQIQQIAARLEELNKSLPQMPPGSAPQRKLLRLPNNRPKRHGVEPVHLKSQARKRSNKQKVLRSKIRRIK